jgi:hypothetical protein
LIDMNRAHPDRQDPPIVPTSIPGRRDLARAEVLREGDPLKADLLRVDLDGCPVLVKDYGRKPWWARLLGRIQVAREYRAYRWLGAMEGIPRLVGRVDAFAVAVEWIDGERLAWAANRISDGPRHVARLREVIDRLHAAGLAHLDLRSNKNVLLRRDGAVIVVDFASAVRFRPGGLAHRAWFEMFRANDLSAYVKWKRTLEAGELTPDERSLLARHRRFRRWWFVNPKGRGRD